MNERVGDEGSVSRTRRLLLSLLIVVPLLVGVSVAVGDSWCEHCYWKSDGLWGPSPGPGGTTVPDARCCLVDSYTCDNLEAGGWDRLRTYQEWCTTTWRSSGGYYCDGADDYSCPDAGSGGGGTGGGGGPYDDDESPCNIRPGAVCPAECQDCNTVF